MHYILIDKLEKCNLKLGLLKSIDNGSKTASSTTLLLLFFPVLMVGISQWKKHSSNFCLQARKKIINWQLLAKITFLLWEPINYTFCALMIFQGKNRSVNGSDFYFFLILVLCHHKKVLKFQTKSAGHHKANMPEDIFSNVISLY